MIHRLSVFNELLDMLWHLYLNEHHKHQSHCFTLYFHQVFCKILDDTYKKRRSCNKNDHLQQAQNRKQHINRKKTNKWQTIKNIQY